MSELEKEPESPSEVDSKVMASPKSQMVALLTLLPVLGILWLTMQYLPKFGDWMGEKADSVVSAVSGDEKANAKAEGSGVAVANEIPHDAGSKSRREPDRPAAKQDAALSPVSASPVAFAKADFKSQIIEQLGGSAKVEVRHLAVSDDGERLVAALKLIDVSEGGGLIEVFFDRDDFGRFLSSEDSPVPEKLVIWSE